jgi:hypothetical protein
MTFQINFSDYPSFTLNPPADLVRVGGSNDGGYLTSYSTIIESSCLLSIGISYDVNFEYEYKRLCPGSKPIHMYDRLTKPYSPIYVFSRLRLCIKFLSVKPLLAYLRFLIKFRFILNSNGVLFKKNVSRNDGIREVSMKKSLKNLSFEEKIFLKIDIEGNEYELLPEIVSQLKRFSAIIIEFHFVSKNFKRILMFVDSLKSDRMFLDHIHVNNYAGVGFNGLPEVIEFSFSRATARNQTVFKLPNNLDSPNSPLKPDYEISFKQLNN